MTKLSIALALLFATTTACVDDIAAGPEDDPSLQQDEQADLDQRNAELEPVDVPEELQVSQRLSCTTTGVWVGCGKGAFDCHFEVCTVCCSGAICSVWSCHRE